MSLPLVSIVTSTWLRHDLLLNRCIPSVQNQTYPAVEHIIVSDGPDLELAAQLRSTLPVTVCQDMRQGRKFPVWYHELPVHDLAPHWGTLARLLGIEMAAGDLIGYVDDDDALRPEHCALLAKALADHPDAGWAQGIMASHSPSYGDGVMEIGHGEPSCGNVGTPMLMHRRETLEAGTWGTPSDFEDWELVNKWIHAGVKYVQIPEITVDAWPSLFYGPGRGGEL